jgi:opacity protein-like surface antigen
MKLIRALCGLAAIVSPLAAGAQSTTEPAVGFGILGGATFPVGDYNDVAPAGFNIGGFADFGRRLGPLGIRLDVLYHGFGDKNLISTGGDATELTLSNKYSMVTGTLNAMLGIPLNDSPVRPYLTGGVGGYYVRNSPKCSGTGCGALLSLDEESTTKFGLNGGAGIEFGLGGTAAFLESRFHHVFDGTPRLNCIGDAGCNRASLQIVPVSLGVRFGF